MEKDVFIYQSKKTFLEMVQPYCIVKREQIVIALEMLSHLSSCKSGKPVSDDIIIYRERLVKRLKDCNMRFPIAEHVGIN